MATYEILNEKNEVINTIIADQEFVTRWHPNAHRLVPEPEPVTPPEPTAAEKLAASGLSVDELKSLLGIK